MRNIVSEDTESEDEPSTLITEDFKLVRKAILDRFASGRDSLEEFNEYCDVAATSLFRIVKEIRKTQTCLEQSYLIDINRMA